MRFFNKKYRGHSVIATIMAFVLSFPVTGFLNGIFTAITPVGESIDIKGRLLIGALEAVVASLSFGKPWGDNEPEMTLKFRILVFIVFIFLTILIFRIITRRTNKKP